MIPALIVIAVPALLSAAVLIRSHYERKQPVLTEYEVKSSRLPESFHGKKLIFLSDLHGHVFSDGSRRFYRMILEASPDAVLIGGDMMTVKQWAAEDLSALDGLLGALGGRYPVYYANGNHELRMEAEPEKYPGWYENFRTLLKKYGVIYLNDRTVPCTAGGESILISGFDFDTCYFKSKFHTRRLEKNYIRGKIGEHGSHFRIILAHTPSYLKDFSAWGADLVLSGHFHGGTIRIPGLGGLMTPQFQFFSQCARGRLEKGQTVEIVSGGLGTHSINIRFNNRPEVILITLLCEDKK